MIFKGGNNYKYYFTNLYIYNIISVHKQERILIVLNEKNILVDKKVASFIFSISAIYGKKLTKNMNVMVVTGYSLSLGGIILILLGIILGGRVYHFTMASSLILIYLALLSSAAFLLWNLLLKYNKVGHVSVFNFLTPIFGSILSVIFLGENIFEYKNMIALVLVCLGIWMVNKEKTTWGEDSIYK